MSSFTAVDLSKLPAPNVVETISFEAILAEMIASLLTLLPNLADTINHESEPLRKLLEVTAYRETLLRQRINESAKATMLAYARDADLDQIAANFGVQRLIVTPGDPSAIPPVPEIRESNEDLRRRVQLSFEGFTTAGSQGSYVFAALNASGLVRDANADSLVPGEVLVYVLSREGNGTASEQLIDTVRTAVNAEKVRPMTDKVTVLSAAVNDYEVEAVITTYPGPDSEVVRAAAQAAAQAYVDAMHRMAYDVTLSGLYAALHQAGVQRVDLIRPAENIVNGEGQASYCTSITVAVAESHDV